MPLLIQKPDLTWEAIDWTSPLLEPHHERALKNIFGRFRFVWVGTDVEVEDEWTKSCLLKQMDKSWGDMKATCHNKVTDKSTEEKLAAKPDAWTTDYWNALLFHFESDSFLEESARGKRARALVTCISHAGAHGASEWSYEQSQITRIEPSPVERIDYLHRRADGTPTSELVGQRSERMHGIVLEAEAAAESQGSPLTPTQKFQIANRAVVQVYGRHSHGRVRGGGRNITPSQYNQLYPSIASRSTKSTTMAATSSSVEEDARRYHELRQQIENNPELQRYIEESGISIPMGLFRGNGS